MDLLEFVFELVSWLFEGAEVARFWRVISSLLVGLALGFWITTKVPRKAVGRMIAVPVVVAAGVLGCWWHRRA